MFYQCVFTVYFRCGVWIQNCRRQDLKGKEPAYLYANCVLCADHFEDSQFMNVQVD